MWQRISITWALVNEKCIEFQARRLNIQDQALMVKHLFWDQALPAFWPQELGQSSDY